jgi:hypothetical protein
MVGDQFRRVIASRIQSVKAVVVLWTEASKDSKWVIDEADRGTDQGKLICLREASLKVSDIPPPFSSNDYILKIGDLEPLLEALARFCRRK